MNNLNPSVTIIILTWNRPKYLVECVKSCIKQSYKNKEILIVDNGSDVDNHRHLKSELKDVEYRYVRLEENFGCPDGRNKAVSLALTELVFFVDDDGLLNKNAVERAVGIYLKFGCSVVAGVVVPLVWNKIEDVLTDEDVFPEGTGEFEVVTFSGGISLINRVDFEACGGFPSGYFYGFEESHLSLVLIDKGKTIMCSKSVVLYHNPNVGGIDFELKCVENWSNKLKTYNRLAPICYRVPFLIYFFSVYPFFSLRVGIKCFLLLIGRFPSLLLDFFITLSRGGVSRKSWKFFWEGRKN